MKTAAKRMRTQVSKNFGMYEVAAELKTTEPDVDIIHLEVGRPSADTPLHIKEATKTALDNGVVHYGDLSGSLALREAIANRYRVENKIDVNSDEILITNGVTQASFAAFMALIEEGDEVIVLEPYYSQHNSKIELMGGKVVTVPLDCFNNFRFDPDTLEAAITDATCMVVLVNPTNPLGTVFSREELTELSELAIKYDFWVMADEVYEYNLYDNNQHISIASLPNMKERTITISAFTKGYAMDGWRVGYVAAPQDLVAQMKKITMNDTAHPCVFAQEGALSAVSGEQDCVREMVTEDQRCRDLIVARLNAMPGVICNTPQATLYAFPDFSAWGMSSDDLATTLLEQTHVAIESGTFYGQTGEGFMRLCFASEPYARLEEAMDRLDKYFSTQSLPSLDSHTG